MFKKTFIAFIVIAAFFIYSGHAATTAKSTGRVLPDITNAVMSRIINSVLPKLSVIVQTATDELQEMLKEVLEEDLIQIFKELNVTTDQVQIILNKIRPLLVLLLGVLGPLGVGLVDTVMMVVGR